MVFSISNSLGPTLTEIAPEAGFFREFVWRKLTDRVVRIPHILKDLISRETAYEV